VARTRRYFSLLRVAACGATWCPSWFQLNVSRIAHDVTVRSRRAPGLHVHGCPAPSRARPRLGAVHCEVRMARSRIAVRIRSRPWPGAWIAWTPDSLGPWFPAISPCRRRAGAGCGSAAPIPPRAGNGRGTGDPLARPSVDSVCTLMSTINNLYPKVNILASPCEQGVSLSL